MVPPIKLVVVKIEHESETIINNDLTTFQTKILDRNFLSIRHQIGGGRQ